MLRLPAQALADLELSARIAEIHRRSSAACGAALERIYAKLGWRLLRQCHGREFFHPECELPDLHHFQTQLDARLAIFEFIERWYDPHRRHSALGYLTPIKYEIIQPELITTAQHRPPNRGNSRAEKNQQWA